MFTNMKSIKPSAAAINASKSFIACIKGKIIILKFWSFPADVALTNDVVLTDDMILTKMI